MSLKKATEFDPRGLIAESYAIEGISVDEAKSIFMDWAMRDLQGDPKLALQNLYDIHAKEFPSHPMSVLLVEGLNAKPKGRRGRRRDR